MTKMTTIPDNYDDIRAEIVELLKAARSTVARNVNSIMTATYWEIGRRIVEQELRGEARANYGEQLLELLAKDLTKQFGRGFGNIVLWRMRAFYRGLVRGEDSFDTVEGICQVASQQYKPLFRSVIRNPRNSSSLATMRAAILSTFFWLIKPLCIKVSISARGRIASPRHLRRYGFRSNCLG